MRPSSSALVVCYLLVGTTAYGAPVSSSGPDADRTEEARALYNAGRRAYSQGEYTTAYAEFRAAWDLKKQWQIAGNLGDAEMRLEMYREAAEHLSFAVRIGPFDPATRGFAARDLARMREGLDEAKKRVAILEFIVEPDGAEVVIDGVLVGVTPLADPVYLEPGTHELETRAKGCTSISQSIKVTQGSTIRVVLRLEPNAAPQAPLTSTGLAADGSPAPAPAPPAPAPPAPAARPNLARTAVLAAEGGLLVTAAVVGTIFSARASSATGRVSTLRRQAMDAAGPHGCAGPNPAPACSALLMAIDDHRSAERSATIAWTGAGVLSVVAVGTLLFWPKTTAGFSGLRVQPQLDLRSGGIWLSGSF
jgi:hypothetical protein